MNILSEKGITWGARLGIVLLFSLLGHSFSRLEAVAQDDGVIFALAGASFAVIAVTIGALIRPATKQLEHSRPSVHLLGIKIGVVGFLIALCGWLVAIYINEKTGFVFGVVGFVVGFAGMLIHFYYMFFGDKNA